jgi:integrase
MAQSQGVRARHARTCRGSNGQRCSCSPRYEAFVYIAREQRKLRKSFETQAAAKAWRADMLSAANRRQLRTPTTITLRQAAGELAGVADGSIPTRSGGRYKPSVIRSYEASLRLRLLPELGDRRLADVSRADVQDLADRLTGAGLTASTVSNALDPLRVIYRRAIRRDLVTTDPTKGLELRRPDGRRDRIASPDEARELLAALPDEDRALWATALYAGLRRGELRGLRWSDVDLEGRVIRVQRGWDDKEGEQAGKSRAARREVPILDLLAPELAAHKLRSGGRAGDDLVFGRTASAAFVPSTIRLRALAAWKAENEWRLKDADDAENVELLEPLGLHEARHTFASLMIAAGANIKSIQAMMGHAAIAMTLDTYGHLMPGSLDAAAAAANAYLARGGGRPGLAVVS